MSSFSGGILQTISGSQSFNYVRETDTYSVQDTDFVIEMAQLSGTKTVGLPALAETELGRTIIVVNTGLGTSRVRGASPTETISGQTQINLVGAYKSLTVIRGQSQWITIGESG